MATPKFDRGHEERISRAKRLYGENYTERLQVFIDSEALDSKKKQGSILVIAEVMGLLGREGLSVTGFKMTSQEGRELEMFYTDLVPRDFVRFEKLFAEHALDEERNPGKHSVIQVLKKMCQERQSIVLVIKKE
ncbi:MAG: hypothetical protein EOM19_02760 [Candidatus Moranbacteria bacterium]|nr:hypothetical protein [Candidatus Moranbacteria bacterium]